MVGSSLSSLDFPILDISNEILPLLAQAPRNSTKDDCFVRGHFLLLVNLITVRGDWVNWHIDLYETASPVDRIRSSGNCCFSEILTSCKLKQVDKQEESAL